MVIILSDQYPRLLFATMETGLWSGHSAATVYTISKTTSGKRYWSVKIMSLYSCSYTSSSPTKNSFETWFRLWNSGL